ncbi:cysteine hydrolase family protein [Aliiroseovarius crassostreae]|uniref:cysteine hydrolase family protein n=1 Tax=Aliiroseovarius crassostreae TaxID=154981 RepID=UPI002205D590|nr:cysteine hydrolase [Aliiroseovarius crassostreae]UWQ04199.1 cysteine hydrolase [Aliiroseovarius crassostreae]
MDLQEDFWNSGQYDEADKTQATQAIRAAVTRAKSEDHPVITLRQEWSTPSTRTFARIFMKGQGLAGQPGARLASPFADMGKYEVIKRVQDGFETGALDTLLDQLDIGHVQIAGLDAAFCVNKTAQAALARGYKVTLLQDGTLGALPKATAKAFETLKNAGAEAI